MYLKSFRVLTSTKPTPGGPRVIHKPSDQSTRRYHHAFPHTTHGSQASLAHVPLEISCLELCPPVSFGSESPTLSIARQ
ncbi:hypothetical protein BKA80DRAFT_270538 [Phyllosticta citrichinensis]